MKRKREEKDQGGSTGSSRGGSVSADFLIKLAVESSRTTPVVAARAATFGHLALEKVLAS